MRPLLPLIVVFAGMSTACGSAEDDAWGQKPHVTRIDLTDEVAGIETSVPPGRIVVWTNRGTRDHSATSVDGIWDTGRLRPGQSAAVRIEEPGDLEYTSVFDPSVRGRLHVAPE